jgi:hypothetical protein
MASLMSETLLSLSEAGRSLPRQPGPSTLWRWHRRGISGVKLETVVIGGRRYTSHEALRRFVDATTSAREPGASPATTERPDVTHARLEEAGLL